MKSLTLEQFEAELAAGKYAWPGGYERHAIMADGESVCFDCVEREAPEIRDEIAEQMNRDWRPVEFSIYWEGAPMQCAHCNRDIESAYGDPEGQSDDN